MEAASTAQMEKMRLECEATGCEFKTPNIDKKEYPAMVAHLQVVNLISQSLSISNLSNSVALQTQPWGGCMWRKRLPAGKGRSRQDSSFQVLFCMLDQLLYV